MSDPDAVASFRSVYDRALPDVYGYLLHRCGNVATAEDLTSETFLAAARSIADGRSDAWSVAWIIGVARHKLVDHWRRRAREERSLQALDWDDTEDPWPERFDEMAAVEALRTLGAHHQAALTLRYIDD
ncbi:MAG TPA: RNA polymerase sigma factor, partial [Acidimicrobiales bacterium]|nr:RNA polymerase sigma factor [Acidimicrobiales bacterium]